jgi:hypothetical protein
MNQAQTKRVRTLLGDQRRHLALALVGIAVVGLAGCAAPDTIPGDYPDIALADTKSPTQLLRNEATDRLPAEVIDQITESEDTSVACLSETDDPKGLIRSWHSTADVTIVNDGTADVDALVDDLVASFVDQGWTARALGGNASVTSMLLESDSSLADMQISGLVPNPDQASTALEQTVTQLTVQIQVHGPCVRTDGPKSDEVLDLEG